MDMPNLLLQKTSKNFRRQRPLIDPWEENERLVQRRNFEFSAWRKALQKNLKKPTRLKDINQRLPILCVKRKHRNQVMKQQHWEFNTTSKWWDYQTSYLSAPKDVRRTSTVQAEGGTAYVLVYWSLWCKIKSRPKSSWLKKQL